MMILQFNPLSIFQSTSINFITRIAIQFLLVFCCSFSNLFASKPLTSDTSIVELKTIDTTKIENFRSDSDFIYDRIPPPPETPWESFKRWFWEQIAKLFNSNEFSIFWDYFKWILIVVLIFLAILWIFKSEIRGVFINKKASNVPHFIAADENIHEMNFDVLIEKAINEKNYKEAIRLSYLKVLKQLTDADLIRWEIDKTNLDYANELANSEYEFPFNKVTKVFEYLWYGDFELNSTQFNVEIKKFIELSTKLKN
ncbi:MAG: hypothetical protein K0B10_11815 [Vicingaceae bacterium]|nr:hypothetical protein [Vicingaceae bacterium]